MNPSSGSFRRMYSTFDTPVTDVDCGQMCASHNPSGKPFCCDICHAVPAVYHSEWVYLQENTDLWRPYRPDECAPSGDETAEAAPAHMRLLACLGPNHCQRSFRSLSCRQFPFFPYINSSGSFIGLAYDWDFEPVCWVISNLHRVTPLYREEFIRTYDELLAGWGADFKSYYLRSEEMREVFARSQRRIPLLHRNGHFYLISPVNERIYRVDPSKLQRFGFYKDSPRKSSTETNYGGSSA